jgi:hypothetical protein
MKMLATCGLTALIFASPALAGFDVPTRCTGTMVFYNSDGSFETYDLIFGFAPDSYRIEARNIKTGEATEDSGTCGSYLGAGCRHDLRDAEGVVTAYYTFTLSAQEPGKYLYREVWGDGFSGQTALTCAPVD